jgi:hypothetical protein
METNETHEKIINLLKEKGPSLPMSISKGLEIDSLFISAFLSELANQKRVKVTNLKVGGSPLYYLGGQEELLEPYYKYFHPKEAEAFLLLKQSKVLKDEDQDPAIRVALRSIKDFAVGFKKEGEIYWRYILVSEETVRSIFQEPKKSSKKQAIKKEELKEDLEETKEREKPKEEETQKKEEKSIKIIPKKQEKIFHNPLAQEPIKQEKPKSKFVEEVINFLSEKYQIIEEKEYKAKEYNCLLEVKSDLGPIKFLTLVKDKKSVSETDLKKILAIAQSIPLPALFVYTGKLSKKAQEFALDYSSILKTLKIE